MFLEQISTAAKDRRKQQRGSAPVPPWYPRGERSPQQAAHDTAAHDRWEQAKPEAWSHSVSPRRLRVKTSSAQPYSTGGSRPPQIADTRQVESRQQQVEPLRLFATSPGENHLSTAVLDRWE